MKSGPIRSPGKNKWENIIKETERNSLFPSEVQFTLKDHKCPTNEWKNNYNLKVLGCYIYDENLKVSPTAGTAIRLLPSTEELVEKI